MVICSDLRQEANISERRGEYIGSVLEAPEKVRLREGVRLSTMQHESVLIGALEPSG